MLNDICTKPYCASFVDKYLKKENISRVPNSYLYVSEKKKKCHSYLRSKSVGLKHIYMYILFIYEELRIAVFF